jgi:aspartyl protease family protein
MKSLVLAAVAAALTVALVLLLEQRYPGALRNEDNQISLIWSGVVLVSLIGSLTLALRRERLGSVARSLILWLGLGLALVAGYSFRDELAPVYRRVVGNLLPAEPVAVSPGVVALRAGSGGHFRAAADIAQGGGAWQRVTFLVDTGASDVALTRDDARRLGIDVERLTYNIPYRTANGTSLGARVRLDRVRLGDIVVEGVAGSVVQGELDQSLLGMSFLRRLSGFEIRGDEMILKR